jgi:hypothetical protein
MSSYLSFAGHFYEQTDSMAMRPSPVITNFFMEDFKKMTLDQPAHNPLCWFHYVDLPLFVWSHYPKRLRNFPDHLEQCAPKHSVHRDDGKELPPTLSSP